MTETKTYPLRLPRSLKEAVERGAFPAPDWDLRMIGERVPRTALMPASILESLGSFSGTGFRTRTLLAVP